MKFLVGHFLNSNFLIFLSRNFQSINEQQHEFFLSYGNCESFFNLYLNTAIQKKHITEQPQELCINKPNLILINKPHPKYNPTIRKFLPPHNPKEIAIKSIIETFSLERRPKEKNSHNLIQH